MGMMSRRVWIRGALGLLAGGCGRTAIPTPTPAAALNTFALRYKQPSERFYTIVFSGQSVPRRPAYTHTWIAVIRTVEQPGQTPALDVHTISWLPATLDIQPLRLKVEPGVNRDLHTTLRYVKDNGERVSMWGPYETHASFYRRILVQKQFLESGQVGYQCIDNVGEAARTGGGCNCIHAITDSDPNFGRDSYPLVWYGDAASEHLSNRLHRGTTLINPEVEHDWLIDALGLNCYCIRRRYRGDRCLDFPRVPPGSRRRNVPTLPNPPDRIEPGPGVPDAPVAAP